MPGRLPYIHTPRYLLRRRLTLHLLQRYPPGHFLEIGCGRGELLSRLADQGFHGLALEISPYAASVAERVAWDHPGILRVVRDPADVPYHTFEYLIALEVLEHIEDDHRALLEWKRWLAPGGVLVLSVPARMGKWGPSDEYGGHYRRYERAGLIALLLESGFRVEHFWSYGFPLTELTRRLRSLTYASRLEDVKEFGLEERTLRSSFDSTRTAGPLTKVVAGLMEIGIYPFHLAQLPFRHTDLGDGYLVGARLRASMR